MIRLDGNDLQELEEAIVKAETEGDCSNLLTLAKAVCAKSIEMTEDEWDYYLGQFPGSGRATQQPANSSRDRIIHIGRDEIPSEVSTHKKYQRLLHKNPDDYVK